MATRSAGRSPARRPERGTDVQTRSGRTRYFSDRQGRALTHEDTSGAVHKFRQQGRDIGYRSPGGTQVTARVPQGGLPPRTYHRIVLAEFVACVVLIGASPILTPRTRAKGNAEVPDTSVSFAGPLVRLTAVAIVFFVLALMASGPRTGKIAAAFGGLVTLGVLINATDSFAAIGKAFGPGKGPGAGEAAAGGGAERQVNAA